MPKAAGLALVLALTLASGLFDARGFVYAARAWPGGRLDPGAATASLASFVVGVSLYVVAVRFMQGIGIAGVALQSAVWFVATAIGIALMDGTILQWTRLQQLTAIGIAIALTWLIATTSAASGH
ncbi:MAG: hypothetical protein NAOJABEB_00077 [Steroidobacteraceae bacterium]|nr:hypothetical protein [Steroidobacteraceae bacterium]